MNGKPTVISTFAGCGGSSLGYHLAGFNELLAVEWDDNAVETFKLNFPDIPVYHGDIAKLSGDQCMRLAGVRSGELDVFDGSPPCQGFSISGKRKLHDLRNSLFKEYAQLIYELQPKVFVMENVTGMIKGHMKKVYLECIGILRDCGYRAKGQVMNAMYYNVPQSRERVIIIGVRKDLGIEPSHPKPQNKAKTIRDGLKGVDNSKDFDSRKFPEFLIKVGKEYNSESDDTKLMKKLFLKHKGASGSFINTKITFWNRPSCTLPKNEIYIAGLIHPNRSRYFTIPELKRLSSFPDDYIFPEHLGRKNAVERMGNSVPPNLMKAIALHIKDEILAKIN